MVIVKFVVLFLIVSCVCYSKYCNICTNHVLCKYSTPGPDVSCREYDRNTFLTDDDIYDLVNQINERRNFIALGHSRHLPSAANMNKLVWSEELATFAQRWVDQCDPSVQPDKEDQCRDLEHTKVGQNIASIVNPSPRFNVKSFIEMWFMQLLDYKGSVTYYNRFQDHISNYFTQLIWAGTENVGCGRAKFNINNVTIERLVCNFSPKGNVHGKPIYTIGYPKTQCQNQVAMHDKYKGLCTQSLAYKAKLPSASLPVSSLLKILNLSNDSVKQEIDPIYNNVKQIIQRRNEMESSKHPILRHIFGNQFKSKRTDFPHWQAQNFWESPVNVSRNYRGQLYNRDKGYSRSDHSHIYRYTNQPTKSYELDIYRKHVKNTYSQDIYRNNFKKPCTRSTEHNTECENTSEVPLNLHFKQCTRGPKSTWQMTQYTKKPVRNTFQHIIPNELCPCIKHSTISTFANTERMFKLNCECVNSNGLTIHCPNLLRTLKDNEYNSKVALESEISYKDSYPKPEYEYEYEWLLNKGRKILPQSKRSRHIQSNRNRNKRNIDDFSTIKPFWQIDSYSYDGNSQLKSLRYTTLPNKRQRKIKKRPSKLFTTESITMKIENSRIKPVTEKYLSFDELLHLRKFNVSGNNARRKIEPEILRNPADDKTTTVVKETTTMSIEPNSTDYTTNTQFIKMKHCTRKHTCTWTASSMTDSNGSIVGGSGNQGTRTPPGYVEGCTRTSTCTRDYMNRNKFPTIIMSSTNDDDDANNDSDYCERRSLDLRKRNAYNKKRSLPKKSHKEVSTKADRLQASHGKGLIKKLNVDHLKKKRSLAKNKCSGNNFSYGDLYYMVLSKIIGDWENNNVAHKQCPCSRASEKRCYLYIVLLLFIIYSFYYTIIMF